MKRKKITVKGILKLIVVMKKKQLKIGEHRTFNGYSISITEPMTLNERVKKYYKNNPHKVIEINKKRCKIYHERKKKKLCAKCGSKNLKKQYGKTLVLCVKCSKRNDEYNKYVRKKSGKKVMEQNKKMHKHRKYAYY